MLRKAYQHGELPRIPYFTSIPQEKGLSHKFSKDICDARQRMGLTQEQCAEALHLSIREFQNIEAGRFTPRLPTFLRIIDFFGLDFDDYREAVS